MFKNEQGKSQWTAYYEKMNFQKFSIIKAAAIIVFLFFSNPLIYSQNITASETMISSKYKFGVASKLNINEKVYFDDSLSIILTSFSHKRPYTGGATKATAYLSLSKDKESGDIMLSVHGIDGKSKSDDGLSDSDRYDSLIWKEYKFQLKSFDYDNSIEIIVSKRE